MRDERVEKLADVLVDYSVGVKPRELVLIRGPYIAEPLLLALYRRCLDRGAHVTLRPGIPAAEPIFYKHASDEQLEFIWEPDKWITENIDASFAVLADTNTRQLSRLPPDKQTKVARARKSLFDTTLRRSARGEYRWTLTLFPTEALAMQAEMSLEEYEEVVYSAALITKADPVAEWRNLAERHRELIEWIKTRKELHIEADGTDLLLGIEGRKFIPADGTENFPDGEIFTGPHEDRTRGRVTFTYPSTYRGRRVEGIQLEFEAGRVVSARADTNEDFLIKTLDTDEGARVLGEVGIGTNFGITDFTGETLLDEKIAGTVHLALGASYPESGGKNESAVHWDMVCDLRRGGRLTADGEVLMEDGQFRV